MLQALRVISILCSEVATVFVVAGHRTTGDRQEQSEAAKHRVLNVAEKLVRPFWVLPCGFARCDLKRSNYWGSTFFPASAG